MLRNVARGVSRRIGTALAPRCSLRAWAADEESSVRSRHMHPQRVGGALVAGTVLAVAGTAALLTVSVSPARCSPAGEGQRARQPTKSWEESIISPRTQQLQPRQPMEMDQQPSPARCVAQPGGNLQPADEASAVAGVSPSPSLGEHPTAHMHMRPNWRLGGDEGGFACVLACDPTGAGASMHPHSRSVWTRISTARGTNLESLCVVHVRVRSRAGAGAVGTSPQDAASASTPGAPRTTFTGAS